MSALFKEVELILAQPHLAVKLEEAFSGIIERIETHRLESKVVGVAPQKIQSFLFAFFRVFGSGVRSSLSVFVLKDFTSAFVVVNVEEDELLDIGHVKDLLEVEVNFHSSRTG